MKVKRQKMTNAGCGGRTNQDWVWCQYNTYRGELIILAVVCDGVGGSTDGVMASRSVVDHVIGGFWAHLNEYEKEKKSGQELFEKLTGVLCHANHQIYEKSRKRSCSTGTTASVFFLLGKRYHILNVGDSRVYWTNGNSMYRTKDQTLYEAKLRNKEKPLEKDSHVLMQSVGSQQYLKPDYYGGEVKGDLSVLMMTDGAYRNFNQKEIYQYCLNGNVQELKKQAIRRKEQDNLSCIWLSIS